MLLVFALQVSLHFHGVVADPSGARIPGARVSLLAAAGSERKVIAVAESGPDGSYQLDADATGSMQLIVEKPGFAIRLAQAPRNGGQQDFNLDLGRIREEVHIKGSRPAGLAAVTAAVPAKPQRIRVGGNIQPPALLRQNNPEYPKELQEKGVEGVVDLDAVISKEGNLLSVRPKAGAAAVHPGLIDAAVRAVQTWQYKPTLLNGEPVEVITSVSVRFLLE